MICLPLMLYFYIPPRLSSSNRHEFIHPVPHQSRQCPASAASPPARVLPSFFHSCYISFLVRLGHTTSPSLRTIPLVIVLHCFAFFSFVFLCRMVFTYTFF